MPDDIQALNLHDQRRLEYGLRQLQVMILQERLATLMGYAPAATHHQTVDDMQSREDAHV